MCRWLAYSGEPLQPSTLVLDPEHSVVAMAQNSPLGAETVNGDGFGLGWYAEDGSPHPWLFRSIDPAWHDENLREICRAVRSPLFFAHVRAATAGTPIQRTNCHPFRHDNWLFMHNGAIAQFPRVKRELMLAVDPELYPRIQGSTDSELLFYLALTYGLPEDPVRGMADAIRHVERVGHAAGVAMPVQATIAVSDGVTLWAFRYSSIGRSRTLFHSEDIPTMRRMYPDFERLSRIGDRARMVVSEPLNDLPGAFLEVPENTVMTVDDAGYHQEPFLA
ncbi:class II glutamine amidotransferase [Microbacterium sp. GXF7504]